MKEERVKISKESDTVPEYWEEALAMEFPFMTGVDM